MGEIPVEIVNHVSNYLKYKLETSTKVKSGDFNALKNYLENHGTNHILNSVTTEEGRTPLHDVCDCENRKDANEMLDKVRNWYKRCEAPKDDKFIDKQDILGNTALHYALKRRNRYAVKQLIDLGAHVNLINKNKEEAVTGIYEQFPKTIMALLDGRNRDKRIDFWKEEEEEDDDDDERNITCDFGAIIGINVDRTQIYETYMLSNVLRLKKEIQAKILSFPIVQLFLDLKWGRMKLLIYSSMLFHMIWSVLTCSVIWNIFMTKYGNGINTTQEWEQLDEKSWKFFPVQDFSWTLIVSSGVLLLFTIFMTGKEIVEAKTTPQLNIYFKQMENWGQIFLIISIFLILFNVIVPFLSVWWDYNLSIVAVIISCLLILGQLNKHPRLGLYMEMFMESLGDFGLLFLWFFPVLLAFTLGFRMQMPLNPEFTLWPPLGLIKIEAMSTGEYNYDDIYGHEVDAIKNSKNILILAFITTVGIVLANLLIGLVVSDVKSLQDKARVSCLRTQLEQMYLMEAFIKTRCPRLAKACRITENESLTTLVPFSYLKIIHDGFLKGKELLEKCFLTIGELFLRCCSVILKPFLPTEVYSSVATTEDNTSHIIQKPVKEFSEESKRLLMTMKTERDEQKT